MGVPAPIRAVASWLRKQPTLGRWSLALIPDVRRTIRIESIGPFVIRLRRHRTYWLRHPLEHERLMFGALSRFIRKGDTVYDVGANIGMYARFMVQAFNAGRVVAFEPMTGNRDLLERNLALGGIADRVTVLPVALSDRAGDEDLQVDEVMSGTAALSSVTGGLASEGHRQYGVPARTERVRTARLDDLAREQALPPPHVIKIDVEGAEALVLEGARDTLRTHRPRLAVELHGLDRARAVLTLLGELNYRCFGHVRRDGVYTWKELTPKDAEPLSRRYDLHFVFASLDEADVRDEVKLFGKNAG